MKKITALLLSALLVLSLAACGNKQRHYYLFSKSGFTDSLMNRAGDGKLRLITLEDMYEIDSAQ